MSKEQISQELTNLKGEQSPINFDKFREKQFQFSLNTKQNGEGLELLTSLAENSTSLIFFDPQYEPVRQVLRTNYPLYSQSDYLIL